MEKVFGSKDKVTGVSFKSLKNFEVVVFLDKSVTNDIQATL